MCVSDCSDVDELRNGGGVCVGGSFQQSMAFFYLVLCNMKNQGIISISCLADVSTLPALILRVQLAKGQQCLCACQRVWIPSALHCVHKLCIFWLPVPVNDIKARAEGRCFMRFVISG